MPHDETVIKVAAASRVEQEQVVDFNPTAVRKGPLELICMRDDYMELPQS